MSRMLVILRIIRDEFVVDDLGNLFDVRGFWEKQDIVHEDDIQCDLDRGCFGSFLVLNRDIHADKKYIQK